MKVTSLCSGSKGNCTFISGEQTNILVDIGISARNLAQSLNQVGAGLQQINAVLITHEHTDHISGLESFAKKHPDIHIYVYKDVWAQITKKYQFLQTLQNVHFFAYDTTFSVGEFTVVALENFHDSASCASFIISVGQSRFGICTDLGIITDYQVEMLSMCKVVMLECNHDKELLQNCSYPSILKQRIAGTHGHLSNTMCATAAIKMFSKHTKVIYLSHISQNSNLPEVAYSEVAAALEESGLTDKYILLTYQTRISKTVTIL